MVTDSEGDLRDGKDKLIYSLRLQMSQFSEKWKHLMTGLGEISRQLISNRLAG